jgi:hypothetical protein
MFVSCLFAPALFSLVEMLMLQLYLTRSGLRFFQIAGILAVKPDLAGFLKINN